MFTHVKIDNPFPAIKRVTINGMRYYQTPDINIQLPSVTTVLSKADKKKNKALDKWRKAKGDKEANRIRNISAVRGTGLHNVCDKYLQNDPDHLKKIMPNVRPYFMSLKPCLDKIDNVHYQEKGMYSLKLGLAGTVDLIAEYDSRLSVIDYKNARAPRTEEMIFTYFLQATAYGLMYNEWVGFPAIKQLVILMAVENVEEPQVFIKPLNIYIKPLLEIITNYNKEMINKG